jgi:hypothetical protein
MRRLLPLVLLVLASACFAPLPCTQALCPSKVEGTYRITGWNRAVDSGPDSPQSPVVSDSSVSILTGRVEFVNRNTVITASEGAAFDFTVSTGSVRVPVIVVSSGSLTVSVSSGPTTTVTPGAPYPLPVKP